MVEPDTVTTCGASVVIAVGVAFAVVDGVVDVIGVGVFVVTGVEDVTGSSSGVDEDVVLPSIEPTDGDKPSNQMVHALLPPPDSPVSCHTSRKIAVVEMLTEFHIVTITSGTALRVVNLSVCRRQQITTPAVPISR